LAKVETKAKDAKTELQDLLTLADSMAGNKRDLASAKAGLADAGDAAIEAAKAKGGVDPEAAKSAKSAASDLKEAKAALAKARKSGSKSEIESAIKGVERAQDSLASANKRVADSFVAPEKAQRDYEASMRRVGEQGDTLIDELIRQKRPISEINAAYEDQRKKLVDAANARGIHGAAAEKEADKVSKTVEQMDDLRFQYANTQAFVDTQIRTPGLPQAKAGVKGYWEVINGVPTFKQTTFTAFTKTAAQHIADLKTEIAGIPRTVDTLVRIRSVQNEVKLALNGVKGYDTGGYTGAGGKYQPAGIVHAEEFVLRKEATASLARAVGMAGLDYMNLTGRLPGYASGGHVAAPASSYRSAPAAPFRLDLSPLAQGKGGDNITLNAYGLDVNNVVQRVRRDFEMRDRS
jgi:hypothetical protein